ncbi:internalin, partial [Listeria innocua]
DISPLAGLINLTNLQINQNQISDISPLAGLTNLTSLNMAQNKIDNISSLSSLTSLWSLYMANNQISDISSLSNLTKLYRLMFENNQVNNISVLSHMADLSYIDASNNQISDLSSLKDLKNLSTISMTNQQIENKPMIYQSSLVFVNNIKDNTGALVAPETISENGNYKSPNFTWNLPNYINEVSYTFNQEVTSSNGGIAFSGSVIQPLTQAPVLYNAIFDVDGAETSEAIETDNLLKAPVDPTKDGYTFTGWYDSPTGGKKWDFKTDKMPANDIILYAQFSINQYTVTLVEDGRI